MCQIKFSFRETDPSHERRQRREKKGYKSCLWTHFFNALEKTTSVYIV